MLIKLLNNSKSRKVNKSNSQNRCKYKNIYDAHSGNTVVVLNIERATQYESKEFYDHISLLLEKEQNKIIIDMDGITFLDTIFFGTLIKLLKKADKKSGYVKLIVDFNSKPEILSISNFEDIFELYPNLFEAVNTAKAS